MKNETIQVTDELRSKLIRIGSVSPCHYVYTDHNGVLYYCSIYGAMINARTKETFIQSRFLKRDVAHMIEIVK
jgi:hypothetical protein